MCSAAQEQMVPPCSTPGRLAVLHKKKTKTKPCSHLLGSQGDSHQDTEIHSMYTGHFHESLHLSEVASTPFQFSLICQNRWTLPFSFLSPRPCRKVPCHCSQWNRSYFSLCENQSISVGFWSDIDTSDVAGTDTNSVMSGKTNLPQVLHQSSARTCISLSLAACPGSGISQSKLMKTLFSKEISAQLKLHF